MQQINVLGGELMPCSYDPMTGYYRTGSCALGPDETARHLVCCQMTDAFLDYSKSVGNDLSTPRPEVSFPGLVAGARWCLHVLRWREALEAGAAPKVSLLATHQFVLNFVTLDDLKRHAFDLS